MAKPRAFAIASIAALMLTAGLMVAHWWHYDHSDAFSELAGWAMLVWPQLLILALALRFPSLRRRSAPIALVVLTILTVCFQAIMLSDPNGGMLFGFYLAACALLLLVFFFAVRFGA